MDFIGYYSKENGKLQNGLLNGIGVSVDYMQECLTLQWTKSTSEESIVILPKTA